MWAFMFDNNEVQKNHAHISYLNGSTLEPNGNYVLKGSYSI